MDRLLDGELLQQALSCSVESETSINNKHQSNKNISVTCMSIGSLQCTTFPPQAIGGSLLLTTHIRNQPRTNQSGTEN
jgi:hypothetical protein